jgi:hypothetical protein
MPIAPDAPDNEVWQVVFEAGFSTADVVTDVSGRGVGMDVVKRNIQALSGTIDLSSTPGQGTRVTVSVPLTLAIMEAMTIAIAGETYVLPLACVVESLSVSAEELHTLPGSGDTLRVRDEYLPVLHLARLFPPRAAAGAGRRHRRDRRNRRLQGRPAGGRTGRPAAGGGQEPGDELPQGARAVRRHRDGRRFVALILDVACSAPTATRRPSAARRGRWL